MLGGPATLNRNLRKLTASKPEWFALSVCVHIPASVAPDETVRIQAVQVESMLPYVHRDQKDDKGRRAQDNHLDFH